VTVRVNFYAILKDYFSSSIDLDIDEIRTVSAFKELIVRINKESESVVFSCRIAVNNVITGDHVNFADGDIVDLLPPSSGG